MTDPRGTDAQDDPGSLTSPADLGARVALHRSELEDVDARIGSETSAYRRHVLWLVLGVSPGAFFPLLATLSELGASALVVVAVLVTVTEGWRALQSRREIRRLEIRRVALEERLAAAEEGRPLPGPLEMDIAPPAADRFREEPE